MLASSFEYLWPWARFSDLLPGITALFYHNPYFGQAKYTFSPEEEKRETEAEGLYNTSWIKFWINFRQCS